MKKETTPGSGGIDPKDGGTPPPNPPKEPTPQSVEELQNSLNASRRREKEAIDKLDETTNRLSEIEKKIKDAEEAKLKEKAEWQKLAEQNEAKVKELEPFKANWENWQKAEGEHIEKMIEEAKLNEDDKALVTKLPLVDRRAAVERLSAIDATKRKTPLEKGGGSPKDLLTKEQVEKMSMKEKVLNIDKINESKKSW